MIKSLLVSIMLLTSPNVSPDEKSEEVRTIQNKLQYLIECYMPYQPAPIVPELPETEEVEDREEVEQPKQPEEIELPEVESEPEQPEAPEKEAEEVPETTEPVEEEKDVEAPEEFEEVEEVPETPEAPSTVSSFEYQVAELVNVERAKYGLAPLTLDTELSIVARIKSQDMRQSRYFSHDSPNYGSPFDMMDSFGIGYRSAGENIAQGQRDPEHVMNSWMNSSGHRANILDSSFTHIGVGHDPNGNYWTQMFVGK